VAIIGTAFALAFIALLMYWPHFFVKDKSKVDFVGTMYAVPIACVVIVMVLAFSRC
jgi:hypothetical protein